MERLYRGHGRVSSEIPLPVDPPGHPATATRRHLVRRLLRPLAFVGVSGVGWLIDLSTFVVLTELVRWPGSLSNVVSSGLGIAFVFVASHGRLFGGRRADRGRHFAAYVLWQVVLVGSVSLAIDAAVEASGLLPVVVKIGLTPVTIVLNYLVLSQLARWRPRERSSPHVS